MKFAIRKLKILAMLGTIVAPLPLVVACDPVEGVLTYKIVGENEAKTDYIVDVEVNKQFIAKIIVANKNDPNAINAKIKSEILARLKPAYPSSYKTGEFRRREPSLRYVSRTQYKVLFPIRKVITNVPKISKVQAYLNNKYDRDAEVQKIIAAEKDKIYRPDLKKLKAGKERDQLFRKFYLPKDATHAVAKNDYVNFNYIGVAPYMAGKLTSAILQAKLGLKKLTVAEFLEQHFEGKKANDQIQLEVTLPSEFPITNFRNQKAKVWFYITNLQKKVKAPKTQAPQKYQPKEKGAVFKSSEGDKADVYFSLFLEKALDIGLDTSKPLKVTAASKIGATSYDQVFIGLKVGKQISRVVEIETTKAKYQFAYDNRKGHTEEQLAAAIASKLFVKKALKTAKTTPKPEVAPNVKKAPKTQTTPQPKLSKNDKKATKRATNQKVKEAPPAKTTPENKQVSKAQELYNAQLASKYKAVATFDLTSIKTYNKTTKQWEEKLAGSEVALGDRIEIANFQVNYLGLPFDRGAALNHEAYNGKSGFIGTFDQQMETMTIAKQKVITPIFPSDYNTKTLAGKLVKFIIKVNAVRKPMPFNVVILSNSGLKNAKGEKITTGKGLKDLAVSKFKTKLYSDIVREYFAKLKPKVPFVLVEDFYSQVFVEMFKQTKKRPSQDKVIKVAEQRAQARAMLKKFFAINLIPGADLEVKKANLETLLFNNLK